MKYTVEIVIDLSRDRMLQLFDDPENLPKWQEGLVSFEPISGKPGQVGSQSKLVFLMGKRPMEMIETITKRNLPNEFDGTYETKGVFNIVRNQFIALSPNQTKWISENEFQFRSIFMKIMGLLMKNAFPKQSLKYMQDFKAFVEQGIDVRKKEK